MVTITSSPAFTKCFRTAVALTALAALVVQPATNARAQVEFGPATLFAEDLPFQTNSLLETDGQGTWVRLGERSSPLHVSTDAGITWITPSLPNAPPRNQSLLIDSDGTWWLAQTLQPSTLFEDGLVRLAGSTDAGQTWKSLLFGPPAGTQTLGVSLAADAAGALVLTQRVRVFAEDLPATDGQSSRLSSESVVRTSTDGGVSWSPSVSPVSEAGNGDFESSMSLAPAPDGVIVAAWESVEREFVRDSPRPSRVRYGVSSDRGLTWSASAAPNAEVAALSGAGGPSIATDGAGTWLMALHTRDTLGGTIGEDNDILIVRSTDDGTTWSSPAVLNDDATGDGDANDVSATLAYDGSGRWFAAWHRSDQNVLGFWRYTSSTDGGLTWSSPRRATNEPRRSVGGSPDFAFDSQGRVLVAWEDTGPRLPNGRPTENFANAIRLARLAEDCPAAPTPDCHGAAPSDRARLAIVVDTARDQTALKWKTSALPPPADRGDPSRSSYSALCLYDSVAETDSLVLEIDLPPATPCGLRDCWQRAAKSSFTYKDFLRRHGPIQKISMKTKRGLQLRATDGDGKIDALLPFAQESRVTLQFHNFETGACSSSQFSVADTRRNTAERFTATFR